MSAILEPVKALPKPIIAAAVVAVWSGAMLMIGTPPLPPAPPQQNTTSDYGTAPAPSPAPAPNNNYGTTPAEPAPPPEPVFEEQTGENYKMQDVEPVPEKKPEEMMLFEEDQGDNFTTKQAPKKPKKKEDKSIFDD